jgi:hypothetical protein
VSKPEPILARVEMVEGDLGSRGIIPRPAVVEREVDSVPLAPDCVACGKHHGSQGKELGCLRRALVQQRKQCPLPHMHAMRMATREDIERWAEAGSCPDLWFNPATDVVYELVVGFPEGQAQMTTTMAIDGFVEVVDEEVETRVSDPVVQSAHVDSEPSQPGPANDPGRAEAALGGEPSPAG